MIRIKRYNACLEDLSPFFLYDLKLCNSKDVGDLENLIENLFSQLNLADELLEELTKNGFSSKAMLISESYKLAAMSTKELVDKIKDVM